MCALAPEVVGVVSLAAVAEVVEPSLESRNGDMVVASRAPITEPSVDSQGIMFRDIAGASFSSTSDQEMISEAM